MSTKIWEAVRVPTSRLNEYLEACREATEDEVFRNADRTIAWAVNWKKAVAEAKENDWFKDSKHKGRIIRYFAVNQLIELYKQGSVSPYRMSFCIDAGLSIWMDGKFSYIIPVQDGVLAKRDYAVDYHYQDQTDRPENVTAAEYRRRCNTWGRIALNDGDDGWNKHRLFYQIISFVPNGEHITYALALEVHFGVCPMSPDNNSAWNIRGWAKKLNEKKRLEKTKRMENEA